MFPKTKDASWDESHSNSNILWSIEHHTPDDLCAHKLAVKIQYNNVIKIHQMGASSNDRIAELSV